MFATASTLLLASFPIALISAAVSDVRRFIIPNWTSLLLIGGFFVAFAFSGLGLNALWPHLAMFLGAFAVGFGLFALGVWGGGDGKLLAAAALWFNPAAAFPFAFWIAIVGGALGVACIGLIVARQRFPQISILWRLNLDKLKSAAPYGVAIAGGALIAFPQTALFGAYFGV